MTLVSHDFNGGTNDVDLVSGSGNNTDTAGNNYFNSILRADNTAPYDDGQVIYTNDAYEGDAALAVREETTSSLTGPRWQGQLGTLTDCYGRFYFKLDVQPGNTDVGICHFWGGGTFPILGRVVLSTVAGVTKLAIYTDTGDGPTLVSGSAVQITVSAWHRIEWHIHPGTGNNSTVDGYLEARYYADPTAAVGSYDDQVNPAGATRQWAMDHANVGIIDHGIAGGFNPWPSATATQYLKYDAIVAGEPTTWVGPIADVPHLNRNYIWLP